MGSEIHDRKKLKELINRYDKADPQNDFESEYFWKESFTILSIDLNETMKYLDKINANDIFYMSSIFDYLSEHFKSKELVECMERNAKRTGVDCFVSIEYAKINLS